MDAAARTKTESEFESHLIGGFVGDADGPTVIAIGSVHGNEPSGRLALDRVANRLKSIRGNLRGRVYLLVGNVRAFDRSVRYINDDLNRHWTLENISMNTRLASDARAEDREQHELLTIFREILDSAGDEVYVLDLHSTYAGGVPFATVGDTLRNRHFAQMFPVTSLLGIEEQLEGTMLEFLNNEGAVTLGFEAGQHASADSIDNHEALVTLAIVAAGVLDSDDIPEYSELRHRLALASGRRNVFEVRHREPVSPDDQFLMNPGSSNFDAVKRGQHLATNRHCVIKAKESGLIIMPLYQKQGDDGFFIVRPVASIWLRISEILRRLNLADYINLLPGIRRDPEHKEVVQIDTRIARFFPL